MHVSILSSPPDSCNGYTYNKYTCIQTRRGSIAVQELAGDRCITVTIIAGDIYIVIPRQNCRGRNAKLKLRDWKLEMEWMSAAGKWSALRWGAGTVVIPLLLLSLRFSYGHWYMVGNY